MKIRNKLAICLCVTAMTFSLAACKQEENTEQDAYRQYGINCLQSGKYDEAVDAFQKALDQSVGKVGPMEIDICLYKGKAQFLAGDSDDAIATYTSIIEYEKNPAAFFARGSLYFAKGDKEKGLEDFHSALQQEPNNYELYIGISQVFKENDDLEQSELYLDKALLIEGEEPEDFMQKGRIYLMKEDYEKAAENLEKASEGGLGKANFYMGELKLKTGDDKASADYFQKYIDSGEASADDLCEVARTQMEEEEYAVALQYLESAQAMEEPVSDIQNMQKSIIICYENLKDFDTAKKLLKDYIKEYPNDDEAQKEMVFLETR